MQLQTFTYTLFRNWAAAANTTFSNILQPLGNEEITKWINAVLELQVSSFLREKKRPEVHFIVKAKENFNNLTHHKSSQQWKNLKEHALSLIKKETLKTAYDNRWSVQNILVWKRYKLFSRKGV